MKQYTVNDYEVTIPAAEYIAGFRDADKFIAYCRECANYGLSWACPPFSHDVDAELSRYTMAKIIVTKISPKTTDLPVGLADEFISAERKRIETKLLDEEKETGGRSFSYVGSCRHCGGRECTRLCGKPCRHPELVRPSLEAYGFDVCKTVKDLFGFDILWSTNGRLPEYLVLVTALFK